MISFASQNLIHTFSGSFQNPLCCPCYLCACCGGLGKSRVFKEYSVSIPLSNDWCGRRYGTMSCFSCTVVGTSIPFQTPVYELWTMSCPISFCVWVVLASWRPTSSVLLHKKQCRRLLTLFCIVLITFFISMSRMHWVRAVCGRDRSDVRLEC